MMYGTMTHKVLSLLSGIVLVACGATMLVYNQVTIARTGKTDLGVASISYPSDARGVHVPSWIAGIVLAAGLVQTLGSAKAFQKK